MPKNMAPKQHSSEKGSHSFPILDKDAKEEKTRRSDACMLFKPMFESGPTTDKLNTIVSQENSQNQSEDPLAHAHQSGYEQGLAAGRLDACELVQDEVMPVFDDLHETMKQHEQYQQELMDRCTANTLKLALAIVKKITGNKMFLEPEDLAVERTIIRDAIQAASGLNFCFNPQDRKIIETLSLCNQNLRWEIYPQIEISENNHIETGSVACSAKNLEWPAIHQQVTQALKKTMATIDDHSLPPTPRMVSTK